MRLMLQLFTGIIFFLAGGVILAQSGKIAGKVIDASTSEPLPFVNVIVEGTGTGAATNIDGEYFIINLSPGTYSVKASAIGYNSVTIQNINVASGFTASVDFQLAPATLELSEDIVVVATKPLVQKDLTASTSTIGEDLISELPVTEVGDLLQLQAGVTISAGGGIHLRGGRSGQISYQIDGVPMTDAYDNSNVIDVGTNSIKEMQVISGAFNAEYGQAMSGVVNIVTKDGSNELTGSVQSYAGTYLSNKDDIFWNISDFNPTSVRNFEGNLSGPVLRDKLFFFVNGRYYYSTGHLFGKRTFLTTDLSQEDPDAPGQAYAISQSGDNSFVSMNPNERIFGQGKLTYRLSSGIRLTYSYILDRQEYQDYNHGNRLTPDNNLQRFRKAFTNTFSVNHALSSQSFYTLNLSYFFKDYRHYLYEDIYTGDPNRPTFYTDNSLRQDPPYSFAVGGTDHGRFVRNTGTYNAKLDWTSQLNQEINVQFGGEYKYHNIYFEDINLQDMLNENGQKVFPYNVVIPPVTNQAHNRYFKNPQEISGYVQSKFEAFNLIFNAGLRFDVFNPDGKVLADPTDPNINSPIKPENQFFDNNGNGVQDPGEAAKTVADREAYWWNNAKIKYQLSPRLGLAFPISDRGVIHFSYGHFFQLPGYELLYTNPEFELGVGSGNQGLFGNADLEPQKTVKGEIGLQQQLGEDMAVDVTMFFEDFRNLTGTQTEDILVFGGDRSYSKYSNSDFGFSKGIVVKFEKRFSGGLAFNLDYTYSVTKGNASNPADARNAVLGGATPETFIAPLDWDQTHTLNLVLAYNEARNYSFSIIGNFYSGQPYTPAVNPNTRVTQNAFPRNSDYKPNVFNVDLRASKDFALGNTTITLFARVFNLLDLNNARNVYGDTGDPFFSFGLLEARRINPTLYYNELDELYTNPGFFSEPRRVELGVSYNF